MKKEIIEAAEVLLGSHPSSENNFVDQESKVEHLCKMLASTAMSFVNLCAEWPFLITSVINPKREDSKEHEGYIKGAENVLRVVKFAPSRLDCFISNGVFLYKGGTLEYISYFDTKKVSSMIDYGSSDNSLSAYRELYIKFAV